MLITFRKSFFSVFVFSILPTSFLLAQSGTSGDVFSIGLVILAAVIFIVAVYLVSENLVGIEAHHVGIEKELDTSGTFLSKMLGPKPPAYVKGHFIKLTQGHNLILKGKPSAEITEAAATTYAVQPRDFVGMSPIPKVTVDEGVEVLAGEELFFDKKRPEIKYVAPVSGEVVGINRGDKRAITEVIILADKQQKYQAVPKIDLSTISREDLVSFLLETGAWTMIRQRPFDIIPDPDSIPDNIFISTFDTAPFAPDESIILQGQESAFSTGIQMLSKLTLGRVHLGLNANRDTAPPTLLQEMNGVEKHWFAGPHPSGNVGVQIHHIKPISSKDQVWVLGLQEIITLGKLVTEGRYDVSRIVTLGGESLTNPRYVRTFQGAKLADLLAQESITHKDRIISGDVLSGKSKRPDGFLNFYDDQVSVIPEGKEYELFGWLLPVKMRPSVSRTFPGFLFKDMEYSVTTNTHGEERAFVMTGQYEKLLPMSIFPQHLMKAILAKDFERMEGLGIYELTEEDVALCEFACTSKQPLQHILRSGLDIMREQG